LRKKRGMGKEKKLFGQTTLVLELRILSHSVNNSRKEKEKRGAKKPPEKEKATNCALGGERGVQGTGSGILVANAVSSTSMDERGEKGMYQERMKGECLKEGRTNLAGKT